MSRTRATAASADKSKELSRRLVFDAIRQHPVTTRSAIVRGTGLSKATVSAIVAELMAAGLVRETGSDHQPAAGRPRVRVELVPDARLALGAELSDDECRVVLTNLRAEPMARVVRPVTDTSVGHVLDLLADCLTQVTDGVDPRHILGLGIGVPGIVHPPSSTVLRSVVLGWEEHVAMAPEISRRLPWLRRIAILGRGHAATWGECWYGAGRGVSHLVYVRAGTGIGAGLVLNGGLYLGPEFGAGDLGHMTVKPDGDLCRCGNRGCLETVAATGALVRRARQLLRERPDNDLWRALQGDLERLNFATLVAAAHQENPVAVQVLAEGGQWLGLGISFVVNLLGPEMIILGGPLAQAGQIVLEPLLSEMARRALGQNVARIKVALSQLREDAPAIGAASLILHDLTAPAPVVTLLPPAPDAVGLFATRSS